MFRGFVFLFIVAFISAPSFARLKLDKEQIVRIGNGGEPRELDPSISTGVPESHITDNLFEGLTTLDPVNNLKPIPGAAESWTISKDGTVYTFKLRKGATWSDGKPLTARDFVWSWQRALAPKTASEYSYQLYYIKNGKAYNEGKIKNPNKVGVVATDKYTLKVTLEKPTPFFLQLTAFHTLYPVPRHVIEKNPGQKWTRPGIMVTNGPFNLAEWKLNQHIKLVPNKRYWNAKIVKIKEAYFYPIENIDTEARTFFAGKLHKTNEVPVLKIPLYEKQKKKAPSKYHPYDAVPYLGTYYYRVNVTRKPMNDVRVRKALALAIDRTLITERITRGGEQPAGAYTPPGTGGYTAPNILPLKVDKKNLAKAKKLLAKAGYPNGKGFPKVEILYNTSDKHKKIALAIQQMWKKNLNINVGMYNQEWKVYLNSEKRLDYQVSRAGWIGDYPDPNTFLDMFVTNGGNNKTGWSNKKYDKLIAAAAATNSQKERHKHFLAAEKILMDELPIIPIYTYTKPRLKTENLNMITMNGKLVKWVSNVQDKLYLKNIVLAR